jgi:phosphopantetheinyl transferase
LSLPVYFTVIDNVARQKRVVAAKSIILQSISLAMGQLNPALELANEPSGRPVVLGHPEIFISLSHSRTSLACAATFAGPVGIDLEIVRRGRNLGDIAALAFGPAEQVRAARDGPDGFYRIWTLREAIAKAEGIGLAHAADRQDRVASGPDTGDWRWHHWHLAHRLLDHGKYLALATRAPEIEAVDWRYFTPTGV